MTDTPVTDSEVDGDAEAADRPERGEALLVQEGDIAGRLPRAAARHRRLDGDIDLDVEGDRAAVVHGRRRTCEAWSGRTARPSMRCRS